jgi:hypothetical protein
MSTDDRFPSGLPTLPRPALEWWVAAGEGAPFVLLDGARLPDLRDRLTDAAAPPHGALWDEASGPSTTPPLLVSMTADDAFATWLLEHAWGRSAAVFLRARAPLAEVLRHARSMTRAYGPDLEPVLFRYHDPRVLRSFLPICTPSQAAMFFGPVEGYLVEDDDPAAARCWTWQEPRVIEEVFGAESGVSVFPETVR